MAESDTLLVNEVFSEQAVRQWVLSLPSTLHFLFASCPAVMSQVHCCYLLGVAGLWLARWHGWAGKLSWRARMV